MTYTFNISYTIDIEANNYDQAWMQMKKLFPSDAENEDYEFMGSSDYDSWHDSDRINDEKRIGY